MIDAGMDEAVHRFYGLAGWNPIGRNATTSFSRVIGGGSYRGNPRTRRSRRRGAAQPEPRRNRRQNHSHRSPDRGLDPRAPNYRKSVSPKSRRTTTSSSNTGSTFPWRPAWCLSRRGAYARPPDDLRAPRQRRRICFIGDIGWLIDNVTQLRLRPAATIARIGEDPEALMTQLVWLKSLMDQGIVLVPSHDDRLLSRYARKGCWAANSSSRQPTGSLGAHGPLLNQPLWKTGYGVRSGL